MIDWLEGDEQDRRALVKRYSEDRDELLGKHDTFYHRHRHKKPSEKIETILTDICQFHVVDEPLSIGQLALCDFPNRLIIVNSEMERFVHPKTSLELLRRSTLAHELGHIRLHLEEVREGCSLHYYNETRQFADSRSYQKEREADLYAGVFAVPLEDLVAQGPIQNLLKCKREKREMGSQTIWKLIYRYAAVFKVSPSLMKRCLLEFGWIRQGTGRVGDRLELMVRF